MSIEGTPAGDFGDVWGQQAPQALAAKLCGPFAAGYLAEILLGGIFLAQAHNHLFDRTVPRRAAYKVLLALTVFNVIYLAFVIEEAYGLAIRQDRTVSTLLEATMQWNVIPLIAGWIGALAQAFLTVRAGQFIRSRHARWLFFGWQALLIVNELLWSTYTCVMGFLIIARGGNPEIDLPIGWSIAVAIYLSCLAACDLSISIALGVGLRSRIAGFSQHTDGLLRQLIWVALRTAAYTTLLAIPGAVLAGLFSVAEIEYTNVTAAMWLPLPALHSLAFFSTVSSSQAVATSLGGGVARTVEVPTRRTASPYRTPAAARSGVQIMVETQVNFEEESSDIEREIGLRPMTSRTAARSRDALYPPEREEYRWEKKEER
ncbi:hypothetical protein JCM10207_007338 [Rhodosporidiobolus poonsookiae]